MLWLGYSFEDACRSVLRNTGVRMEDPSTKGVKVEKAKSGRQAHCLFARDKQLLAACTLWKWRWRTQQRRRSHGNKGKRSGWASQRTYPIWW